MSDNIFDQVALRLRQRPSSTDHNRLQSQLYRTLRAVQRMAFAGRTNGAAPFDNDGSTYRSGFVGDGFKVSPSSPPGMSVVLRAGLGWQDASGDVPTGIDSVTALDDRERYKPLVLETPPTIVVPMADATNPRIDIVEVKYDRRAGDPSSTDIFTAVGPFQFVPTALNRVLAWLQDGRTSVDGAAAINYKTGAPAGSPAAPAVTAGYVKIAEVTVDAASTSVPQSKIVDLRTLVGPDGGVHTIAARLTFIGTVTGAAPAVALGLNAPPGMCMAAHATVAAAGANYTLYFWGGAALKDYTLHAWNESGGPVESTTGYLTPITLGSGELALINGANGTLLGPAPAIGQPALKCTLRAYQRGTPGTLESADTNVNLTLRARSY